MAETFSFVVPLSWSGRPYADDSKPTSWLNVWNRPTAKEEEAVRFTFKVMGNMREEQLIQGRLDDITGGIDKTVDLEMGISNLYAACRERFELELWPDGKPVPANAEEDAEQERAIQQLWEKDPDRLVMTRMQDLRDQQLCAAEWSVLGVDLPEIFGDISILPMKRATMQSITVAYWRAKRQKEEALGN